MPNAVADPHAYQRDGACQQRPIAHPELLAGSRREPFAWPGKRDGIIHVILEPGAKRDVPSFPEFRSGSREERLAEVFGQAHVEDASDADCDVHGPREVTVELERVKDCGEGDDATVIGPIVVEDRFHERVETVGHDDLLR